MFQAGVYLLTFSMSTLVKALTPFPNDTGIDPDYRHAPKRVVFGLASAV